MTRIHLLDDDTIAKIAAGEIIERPASVVKELVENSIDAGASKIDIEIKNGGRLLIRVADNGSGMTQDEVLLALERHATSKITNIEELSTIKTLGFRGEALPSIAAVSRMEIYTKTRDSRKGTYVEINGGRILKVKPVGCADGTSIYIHDLFFNVPVRLKHLKTIPTEAGVVADMLSKIALAYPEIAFHLIHHNYTVIQTTGKNDPFENLVAIFGKDIAKEMLNLSWEGNEIKIHGWLGKPSIAKSSRQYEIFFVNRRLIRSHIISSSLEKAFHTLLPISRYPFAVVFIEIKSTDIDVNVHPAKQEIKFNNDSDMYKLLYHVFSQNLKQHSLIPNWQPAPEEKNPVWGEFTQTKTKTLPVKVTPLPLNTPQKNFSSQNYAVAVDPQPVTNMAQDSTVLEYKEDTRQDTARFHMENLRILPYVVCKVYIVAEDDKGLILIDIHAAHERILFEKFAKHYKEQEVQVFLIPQNITLTFQQSKAMANLLPIFKDMKFEMEEFGPNTYLLRSVPGNFAEDNMQEVVAALIDLYLALENFHDPQELKEKFWMNLACRKAVKAGASLHALEIEGLVKDLFLCENPFTCPHGRPTLIRMYKDDIEKKFLRRG